jgi:hypothetical protein
LHSSLHFAQVFSVKSILPLAERGTWVPRTGELGFRLTASPLRRSAPKVWVSAPPPVPQPWWSHPPVIPVVPLAPGISPVPDSNSFIHSYMIMVTSARGVHKYLAVSSYVLRSIHHLRQFSRPPNVCRISTSLASVTIMLDFFRVHPVIKQLSSHLNTTPNGCLIKPSATQQVETSRPR